jgi:hypothetical protein
MVYVKELVMLISLGSFGLALSVYKVLDIPRPLPHLQVRIIALIVRFLFSRSMVSYIIF